MRSSVAIAAAVAASVSCVIVATSPKFARDAPHKREAPARHVSQPDERPAYRHSVVRSGVYSSREALSATHSDAVVKAHYTGIQLPRLRPVSSPGVSTFVSYRRGEQVYWTSKRLRIPEGEALLSDGTNMIRARCGNRLSKTPQQPVEAQADEPSESELAETEVLAHTQKPALPLEMRAIASPLDPPPGGYGELSANTASTASAKQVTGGTSAGARSLPLYTNGGGGLGLRLPTVMSHSDPPGLLPIADFIQYPDGSKPVTDVPAAQEPRGSGPENPATAAEPDISAPVQRPDPTTGGTGGAVSNPRDLGYSGAVGAPPKLDVTGSNGTSASAEGNPDTGGQTLLSSHDLNNRKANLEPPLATPEPSSMLLFLAGLFLLSRLRQPRSRTGPDSR